MGDADVPVVWIALTFEDLYDVILDGFIIESLRHLEKNRAFR